jgi:hypothetical protein
VIVPEGASRAAAGGRNVYVPSIDAPHPSMVGLAHYDASKHGTWGVPAFIGSCGS